MNMTSSKLVFLKGFLFFVILFSSLRRVQAIYDCPMPKCETCLPAEVHDALGVGFDLTASYGTSAIHLLNGTTIDVAKIDANEDYIELIRRLNQPSKPESRYDRLRRWLNKKLGRPATRNVGILSDLIMELKRSTELSLSKRLDRVTVTTPLLPALTREDLNDGIEFAGLRSWLIYHIPYPHRIFESNAVFAANGNGLCTQYKNLYECQDEEEEMPSHTAYFISFTRKALYTSLSDMKTPFTYGTRSHSQLFDFDAGLDNLPGYPSAPAFWSHIRSQLGKLPEEAAAKPGYSRITKILLAGESVMDNDFLAALKDAMAQVFRTAPNEAASDGKRQIDHSLGSNIDAVADPVFAAARGAALYSRRRQEAPWNCVEPKYCDERRRDERDGNGGRDQKLVRMELR